MATIDLTRATELHLASMISDSSSPEAAALSILTYLRTAAPTPSSKRTVTTPSLHLTGASLYEALTFLKRAIPSRSLVLSLTYVRITCKLGAITLRTTDGEHFYTATLDAPSHPPIDTLVPFNDLHKLIRSLKKSVIRFAVTDETVDIYADNELSMSFQHTISIDEFYGFPTTGAQLYSESYTIDFLKRIVPFTSDDDSHPVLQSIHIASDHTASADGFVLFYEPAKRAKDTDYLLSKQLILDATKHIKSNISASWSATDDATTHLTTLSGTLRHGASVTLSSLMDRGTFPDVKRIIPATTNTKVRISRLDFLDTLKKVQPVAAQLANIVWLDITDKDIHASVEVGSASMVLSTPCVNETGDFLTIGFSVVFLIEAITSLPCDELLLSFNAANQAATLEASDLSSGIDAKIVIMPMQPGKG